MQLLYGILFFTTLVLSQAQEGLRLYDSTTDYRHFDISLNPDHTLKSYSNTSMVNTTFPLKVIENQYLKVTLLPSCGGRILSIIYKPTGHDLLYQNPVGAPYGIHQGVFYWDFLMNIGGIFPTFPEPEHGKTWDLPWDFEVVTNTSEKISIQMSFTDNIPPYAGMPTRYQKGMTLITCTVTVTVHRDSSFVEYDVKLVNNQNKPVDYYEFWTDMVLAPGSTPGDTKTTAGAEIVIPINELEIDVTKWAWMNTSEASIDPQNSIFEFKNLRWYKNWQDEGIAYAYPQSSAWYGVINHDNEEGFFRVTPDASVTPGIKLWTWGYNQSVNANLEDFDTRSRPFIELWSGKSKEFFTNATLAAQSTETWKEYFIPTVGLDKITLANQNGAVHVDYQVANGSVTFKANVFSTLPNQAVRGSIKLVGTSAIDVGTQQWTTSPTCPYMMQGSLSLESIPNGSSQCEFVLNSDGGEQLIAATIPWTN